MVDITNPTNWTVRNIATEAKDYAIDRVNEEHTTVGIWLAKLILADRDGYSPTPPRGPTVDLRQLAEIMRAAADVMAHSGHPIPKRAVRSAYALLSQELRQARQMTASMPVVSGTASGNRAISAPPVNGSTPAMASSES